MVSGVKCKGKCSQWKNKVNFIPGIPKYAIGDLCTTCYVWFPKHTVLFCSCCMKQPRRASRHRNHNKKLYDGLTKEKIRDVIREKIDQGWKPVKTCP